MSLDTSSRRDTTSNDMTTFGTTSTQETMAGKTEYFDKSEKSDKPTLTSVTEKLNESDKTTSTDTTGQKEERQVLNKPLLSGKKSKMEVSLQNACQSLNELFSPFSNASVPSRLFNEAKGIVFLSVIKGGIGIGGSLGSGILLTRNNNKWGSPCAISLTGLQIGIDIGIERVDYVLLLRDELTLQMFQSKATWNIGSDISIAAGLIGGEINVGVIVDDNMATTTMYSYAIAKGAYIGFSLNGSWIKIRDDWNEEFYHRKMTGKEILFNYTDLPQNEEYQSLIRTLDEYCLTK